MQYCCDIVSNGCTVVPTLQRCVALKIVVACRPVQHHLNEGLKIKSSFIFFSVHSAVVKCQAKILLIGVKPPTLACWSCLGRKERKVWMKRALRLKGLRNHMQIKVFFTLWGINLMKYIKQETQSSSPDETPRREFRIPHAAEYFWRTSRCFIWWRSTVPNAWYYFSKEII